MLQYNNAEAGCYNKTLGLIRQESIKIFV